MTQFADAFDNYASIVEKLTVHSKFKTLLIVLFHNIFFSSSEKPEQRIAAHKF